MTQNLTQTSDRYVLFNDLIEPKLWMWERKCFKNLSFLLGRSTHPSPEIPAVFYVLFSSKVNTQHPALSETATGLRGLVRQPEEQLRPKGAW